MEMVLFAAFVLLCVGFFFGWKWGFGRGYERGAHDAANNVSSAVKGMTLKKRG